MKKRHRTQLRNLRRAVAKLQRRMRVAYSALEELDQRTMPREDVIGFRHEDKDA